MDGGIIGNPESAGMGRGKLEAALELLEKQCRYHMHGGAQLFVARRGIPAVDAAIGEAKPGIPMETDSVMLWFSASKPLTAIAVARLYESGKLNLDDRVKKYIPAFAGDKEVATVRHVLTHTGGFSMPVYPFHLYGWEDNLKAICKLPAEWEPGKAAGYHPHSGWIVLGAVVAAVDGRPIEQYLAEEIFIPLGMKDTTLGLSLERAAALGGRLSEVKDTSKPAPPPHPRNEPHARSRILPGGNGFGPAHDLGRFYLMMWNRGEWDGRRIIKKETHEYFTAVHRKDMVDRTFSIGSPVPVKPVWALGMHKGTDTGIMNVMGRRCTSAAYGHGGAQTSVAFVEPSRDLVAVIVTNGQPGEIPNTARLCEVSDLIHQACI